MAGWMAGWMDNKRAIPKLYQSKSCCVIEFHTAKNATKRIAKLPSFTHAHPGTAFQDEQQLILGEE